MMLPFESGPRTSEPQGGQLLSERGHLANILIVNWLLCRVGALTITLLFVTLPATSQIPNVTYGLRCGVHLEFRPKGEHFPIQE